MIKAKIEDNYSVCSFIILNGSLIDSTGNLVNSYISNQYNSENNFYNNCNYSGSGKKSKRIFKYSKIFIAWFWRWERNKNYDNKIDLTYNMITNFGSKK